MYLKLLMLSVTILGLTNCTESDGQTLYANRRNGGADASATGTGSGGGGYDDNAKIGVEITKGFLNKMIANSDDLIFEKFPDGFKKDNLIQIITDISYSGDERSRDNEPLLFDYDFETKKLFYTKQFVDKYGQYKFSSSAEDDLKNIKEYSSLILHELSHLMGIGRSKSLDNISALFSMTFLNHMLTETRICEGSMDGKLFSLVINPQTGMSYLVKDKVIDDFYGSFSHDLKKDDLSTNSFWQLGSAFSFFDLQGEEASSANQIAVAEFKLKMGVNDFSPHDLLDYLSALDTVSNNLIIWNFENNLAEYNYKMVFNTLNSTAPQGTDPELPAESEQPVAQDSIAAVQMEELGLISINTDSEDLAESELKTEVRLNGQIDSDQSFNIPLNCQKFVSSYDLSSIVELNATNEQNPSVLETQLNQISKKIVFENLMNLHGCNQADLSDGDQLYCDSLKLQIQ